MQSTIDDDRAQTIRRYLKEGAELVERSGLLAVGAEGGAPRGITACDFGCGVGKWLPALAPLCAFVHALDISGRLLEVRRPRGRRDDLGEFELM